MLDLIEQNESVKNALSAVTQPTETRVPPPPPPHDVAIEANEGLPDKPEKPDYATDDYIDSATDTVFALLDNAQISCFTIAANLKKRKRAIQIGGENGVAKLMDLKSAKQANKDNGITINYEGVEAKLLTLDATVDEFIKGLGFTDKQIAMMRPGLKIMVERNAGKIPPELLFYAGLATAIGGNIAEYYSL